MAAQKGVNRVADRQVGGWLDGGICQPLMMLLQFKVCPGNYLACPRFSKFCTRSCCGPSLHITHKHTHKGLRLCVCVCFGVLMSRRQAGGRLCGASSFCMIVAKWPPCRRAK